MEGLELAVLMPPGAAIVAHEVRKLLECGVTVGGQHLSVRVHVDSRSLGLREKLLQVLQVMAGDEYPWLRAHPEADFRDLGIAVGRGVGLVQESHGLHCRLSGLQHHGDHLASGKVPRGRGKGLQEKAVDVILLVAENRGMLGICGDSLAADDEQLPERTNLFILDRRDANLAGCGFCQDPGLVLRAPGGAIRERARDGLAHPRLDCIPDFQPVPNPLDESIVVEGRVGNGGKKGLHHEVGGVPVHRAEHGDTLAHVDEQVLKVRGLLLLAAHTTGRAARVPCSLLALITEHPSLLR